MQRLFQSRTFISIFLICFIAIFAFWEVAFNCKTLKFDMIDANYPFQVLQSQYEQQGQIPMWDPYTYLGNAMHAKMTQWYPLRFISSKISEYTLQKINFDFLLHIIIAGIGMFAFLRRLKISEYIALSLGAAYMLSGFFVGNAQHMSWIVSGALLPIVLLTFYNLLSRFHWKNTFYFSFIFFSFIVGGYPAFTITVVYAFLIYFVWYYIHIFRNKLHFPSHNLIQTLVFSSILLLLLLSTTIVSHFDMVAMVTRGNGISLDAALHDSLQPIHFLTFLFPFLSTIQKDNFWQIDPSMMNMYIGLFVFIAAIYSIKLLQHKKIQLLWGLLLFFIAISLGKDLPIRTFFYNYIPFFNVFRFPALFRLFFIFIAIILAGYSLDYLVSKITKKQIYILLFCLTSIFGFLGLYFLRYFTFEDFIAMYSWHGFVYELQPFHALAIQFISISAITFIYVFILWRSKFLYYNHITKFICFFIVFDLIISTNLHTAFTVTSSSNPKEVQTVVNKLPNFFINTSCYEEAVSMYDTKFAIMSPLWRNNQIFYKQRAYDGYTSFVYTTTEKFEHSKIYDSVKTYPLAYIPSKIYSQTDTVFDYSKGRIAILDIKSGNISNTGITSTIELTSCKGNAFTFTISSNKITPLIFMQNWYPGWKAYINSKEESIQKANYCCMIVMIPKGKSMVQFIYAPTKVIWAYYIFEIALYICIILIIFISIPAQYKKFKIIAPSVVGLFFVLIEFKNLIL